MLIDDEGDITFVMIKQSLELAGSAVDAEPILSRDSRIFELVYTTYFVMLDIRMSDFDGRELYGKLREIDSKFKFKVCFISTFVSSEYERLRQQYRQQYPEQVDSGCFIEKPVTMTKLVR
ncbi:MAG TPA: hypothetical protein VJZ68_08430 [Nitrososphaera sp.]|nr:hypothetical protein [Nitrososphaera sp.]